jgi:hypothetical protein
LPRFDGRLRGSAPSHEKYDGKLNQFFVDWLKGHGHAESDIVVDGRGVGLAGNTTRLKASIYDVQTHDDAWSVETEFHITLPGGEEIVEFLAGSGKSEEEAIDDTLANFVLTTFHVVYKSFLNVDDPHQQIKQLSLGGQTRQVAFGDIYCRGQEGTSFDLSLFQPRVEEAISTITVSGGPHWIKLVYGQMKGEPITVAVTLDNGDETTLTEAVKNLGWPKQEGFYMVKQFIVIQ